MPLAQRIFHFFVDIHVKCDIIESQVKTNDLQYTEMRIKSK